MAGGRERGTRSPTHALNNLTLYGHVDLYPFRHNCSSELDNFVFPYFLRQALCQQTLDDWTAKFSPLGIRLAELTSDSTSGSSKGPVSLRDLASADVILTTPEKWDSVTRRWKEHAFLVCIMRSRGPCPYRFTSDPQNKSMRIRVWYPQTPRGFEEDGTSRHHQSKGLCRGAKLSSSS